METEVKVESTLNLGASFQLPDEDNARDAMLDAIEAAILITIRATLTSNQVAGNPIITSVNGVAINGRGGERALREGQPFRLWRLLADEGAVEFEAPITETIEVVTRFNNKTGDFVDATVNGETQDVDQGATNSSSVVAAVSNPKDIATSIVSEVAAAMTAATSTNSTGEGEGGGGDTPSLTL